jgi:hypothetical protein
VDYREVAACLRVLANGKQLPKRAKDMMLSLFDLWAGEDMGEEDACGRTEPEMIPTVKKNTRRGNERKKKGGGAVRLLNSFVPTR